MIIQESALKEAAALVQKHDKLISGMEYALKESCGRDAFSASEKASLATMLENVDMHINLKAPKILTEAGTQVVDIASKTEYLKLTTAVMPNLVLNDVETVQVMKQKLDIAFYLELQYADSRGKVVAGDTISNFLQVGPDAAKTPSAFNYSAEAIDDEPVVQDATTGAFQLSWKPVVPASVRFTVGGAEYADNGKGEIVAAANPTTPVGTVDYATGNVAFAANTVIDDAVVSYSQDLAIAPVNVAGVKTQIKEVELRAKPRKLKAVFSMDAAFDLSATQNIDLQSLLQSTAVDEIKSEIDGSALYDLENSGTPYSVSFNAPVPFGLTVVQHYDSFLQTLVGGANIVWNATRGITPNIVIAGKKAADIIESMTKFKPAASLNTNGPHIMGTIADRFLVVKNPYSPENRFTITYKGDNDLKTTAIYGTYIPITSTQFLMGANFQGEQGYMTYGVNKLVTNKFTVNGIITEEEI